MMSPVSHRSRGRPPIRRRRTVRLELQPLERRSLLSGYLLVASNDNNSVIRYEEATGGFVDTFVPKNSGGLYQPMGLVFGPTDHNLYVSSGLFGGKAGDGHPNAVLRYDRTTGAFIDNFTQDSNLHLTSPRGVVFGRDGNLYVTDGTGDTDGTVVVYDGTTGAFIKNLFDRGTDGLSHPQGLVFGPDGRADGNLDLYISSAATNSILRYDFTSGFVDTFVPSRSGGLDHPIGLAFGPDGDLYVASLGLSTGVSAVMRYDGTTGAPKPRPGNSGAEFIAPGYGGLADTDAVLFGPDGKGAGRQDLYVTTSVSQNSGKSVTGTSVVLRYDTSGAPAPSRGNSGAVFVSAGSGGLDDPTFLTFTETDPTTLAYTGTTTAHPGAASTARAADPATVSSLQFAILPLAPATDAEGSANGWLSDPMAQPTVFLRSPHKDSREAGHGLRIGLTGPRLP